MITAAENPVVTAYFMKSPRKAATKPVAPALTHFDTAGQAHMVDVGAKAETARLARARGSIRMAPATFELIAAATRRRATCSASPALPRSRPPSAPPT
jgi:hypothetical protein